MSYAYLSRIESETRTPSVKALRRIANRLGVTVEHLETGRPTPTELGVADAGLDFSTLTKGEVRTIRVAVAEAARGAARRASEEVIVSRRERERSQLRTGLEEIGG